jgi:hypothetical protein
MEEEVMMQDIPPVQSMEAVDLHLRLILQKIEELNKRQGEMVTRAELTAEVTRLTDMINRVSFPSIWRRMTEIAVGIVAISTAIGFFIAVVRFFGLHNVN